MTSQPTPSQPEKRPLVWPFFVSFAVYNFLVRVMLPSGSLVVLGVCSGPVAAQLGLLAIWAALGPRPWRFRLPTTLIMAAALFGVLLLGTIASYGFPPDGVWEIAGFVLILPLVFLAVQLPLWILRFATGCRIVFGAEQQPDPPAKSRQFDVQDTLVATALIAIALGLASTALAPDIKRWGAAQAWIQLVIPCVVCSLGSALSTLPCLWAAFVTQEKGPAAIAMGGYALFMAFFVAGVVGAFNAMGGGDTAVGFFLLFNGSLVGVMLGVLHVARACGYVLIRPRRAKRPVPPSAPPATAPVAQASPTVARQRPHEENHA